MKIRNHEDVEVMLRQIKLREPSARLDQAIHEMANSSADDVSSSSIGNERWRGQARFGWPALISTAIVASIFGLMIGQWVTPMQPLNQSSAEGAAERAVERAVERAAFANAGDSRLDPRIVPVKFNPNAFEILHGHSQKDEFSSCQSCHVDNDAEQEAFEGWFYGDLEFFQKHSFDGVADCSKCHRFANEKAMDVWQHEKVQTPNHRELRKTDCSKCHVVQKSKQDNPNPS